MNDSTMVNNGSNFANFARFRPHTFARTEQSLQRLMGGNYMDLLGLLTDWGQKSSPPQNLSHISCIDETYGTVIPHLKKVQKKYKSRDTPIQIC